MFSKCWISATANATTRKCCCNGSSTSSLGSFNIKSQARIIQRAMTSSIYMVSSSSSSSIYYNPQQQTQRKQQQRQQQKCYDIHHLLPSSSSSSSSFRLGSRNNRRFFSTATAAAATTTTTESIDIMNHHSLSPYPDTKTRHELITEFLLSSNNNNSNIESSWNPYELERHGRGESFHPTKRPDVILKPKTIQEIQQIVKFCNSNKIPLIPFGVGTSVEGHICALHGGISLDMQYFNQIIQIPGQEEENENEAGDGDTDTDTDILPDPIAIVGAGVTRHQLNQALRHTGMQFVVDPGADATIGGMVATGASGTTAVRYGTMRENILQVECVLPDGTIVQTGTKALKNSAGYDLLGLLCGSEGTLAVITKITVKLHPIPEYVTAAVCVFDTLKQAAQAVATLKLCEIPVVRCELLDAPSVDAFNQYSSKQKTNNNNNSKNMEQQQQQSSSKSNSSLLKVAPTLFLEFQASSQETLDEQVKLTQDICTSDELGGSDFQFTSNEEERKALWSARHSLYYASLNLRPGANDAILTDACVPISKFADIIQATAQDVQDFNVVGPCFGHAGDGNFHCILPVVHGDPIEYTNKLHQVNKNLIQRTLQAGGTCTGEHGVGYGKMQYLEAQYGPGAVQMMKLIKQALDPNNIMNPGKVVPL